MTAPILCGVAALELNLKKQAHHEATNIQSFFAYPKKICDTFKELRNEHKKGFVHNFKSIVQSFYEPSDETAARKFYMMAVDLAYPQDVDE